MNNVIYLDDRRDIEVEDGMIVEYGEFTDEYKELFRAFVDDKEPPPEAA